MMFSRIRMAAVGAASTLAVLAAVAPSAHAGLLSLAPGACGQQLSEPFAQFGDTNDYALVPGGSFEAGTASWTLRGGAQVVTGSAYDGLRSLSLPSGSSATSPGACTGVDHPSARMFVRNTGSSSSKLNVWATYTPILGLVPDTVYLGTVSGSASWEPSSPIEMGWLTNVIGSADLTETTISFTFAPADGDGNWQIDDVYLDPRCRA